MTPYIFAGLKKEPQYYFRLKIIYHLNDDKMPLIAIRIFQALHIDSKEISSKTHSRPIVEARQIAMYLIKKHLGCTLKTIGAHFGGRDHSSVTYAIQTAKDMIDTNPRFKAKVEALEEKFFNIIKP